MRFGKTLSSSEYDPWKDKYLDYAKLKSMLREDDYGMEDGSWTEDDETRFSDEIFNVQLGKVTEFHEAKFRELRERTDAAFEKLKGLPTPSPTSGQGSSGEQGEEETAAAPRSDDTTHALKELEAELDRITNHVNELKRYSSLNYTGFLKIVKKHDRKRGLRYKMRPLMMKSLSDRPFNSEQAYAPMIHRLSLAYFTVKQQLEEGISDELLADLEGSKGLQETKNGEKYSAHKFWVHPDNLLEVKTFILRRLPNLVYSDSSSKEVDSSEDPSLTSLYFDNNKFDLYNKKLKRDADASSLRLRWYGSLSSSPQIFLEQKIVHENGSSEEKKFTIKAKYIKQFIDGEYHMEKSISKMEAQGHSAEEVAKFKSTVDGIQEFIKERKLEPVIRANYKRTAFQKPADDRVRISIDTDLGFVREDTLDPRRPCRDPNEWHRLDIDNRNLGYPFSEINQSEVSRFPYALLEIKLKEHPSRKRPEWIEDLMTSHLVYPAQRFSKFAHGISVLFDDYVNALPFWLSDLDKDIHREPLDAFEEEEQKKARRAADEEVVGSLLGNKIGSFVPSKSSPVSKSYLAERVATENAAAALSPSLPAESATRQNGELSEERETGQQQQRSYGTIMPSFSILTRYARFQQRRESRVMPEGVVEPEVWIKNQGELKVEPKVWLANERTFMKWQHICVLLGGLSVALYTAAGAGTDLLPLAMGIVYLAIAAFAGIWGYVMHKQRRDMIIERSGRDFDNLAGPMIVSVALVVSLVLNFIFQYRAAVKKLDAAEALTGLNASIITDELLR
ncbi:SPX-domain-containing protein [Cryphonectria parasitica EP155]|uniref:SPX-domain-containing protein n=1 Tax=Cryphonectria parasitica (strain ATCC 38755 / EP155) TaxID=660469 RepID=A0A9P5CQM7_CRYP1|nr:SPX-domain-containing protein [Cryphonectria parasitica EP155]KAF3766235.1 SPX-domain-containing protein [Cryphonectria parasitica EP155]